MQNEQSIIDVRLFFTGMSADISIQSKSVVQVAYISFADFLSVVKQFPDDYEIFCMMKDQFQNDKRQYNQCQSCSQNGHSFVTCKQLHYSLDKFTFVKKLFQSKNQERKVILRKRNFKYPTRHNILLTQANLKIIRWVYIQQQHYNYSHVNPFDEVENEENCKQFYARSPKINQFNKQSSELDILENSESCNKHHQLDTIQSLTSENSSKYYQTSLLLQSLCSQLILQEQKQIMSEQTIKTTENKRIQKSQNKKSLEGENRNNLISEINIIHAKNEFQDGNNSPIKLDSDSNKSSNAIIRSSFQKLDTLDMNTENIHPHQLRLDLLTNKSSHQKQISIGGDKQIEETNTATNQSYGGCSMKNKSEQRQINQDIDSRGNDKQMAEIKLIIQNQIVSNPFYQFIQTLFMDNSRIKKQQEQPNEKTSLQLIQQEPHEQNKETIQQDLKQSKKKLPNILDNKFLNIPIFSQTPSFNSYKKQQNDQIVQNINQEYEEDHIFGKLRFEFEKTQEFEKYYPRNNQSKVIKAYKKWQALDQMSQVRSPKKNYKIISKQSKFFDLIKMNSPILSSYQIKGIDLFYFSIYQRNNQLYFQIIIIYIKQGCQNKILSLLKLEKQTSDQKTNNSQIHLYDSL